MNIKKLLGITGALALFIGVFTPVFSYSLVLTEGNINYFDSDEGAGIIVLILAGISLLLVLTGKFKGLWFTGLGSLAVLLFTFSDFQGWLPHFDFQFRRWFPQTDLESEIAAHPFLDREAMEWIARTRQLEWGWAVLILGVAFVITPAAMKDDAYPSPHWPLRPVALLDLMNDMERIVIYLEKVPRLGWDRCDDLQGLIDRLQKRIDREGPSV